MRCLGAGAVAPNKVVPDFDSPREYLGPHGFTQTIKNARGLELFAYFWPAKPGVPLRGIVQLAHGNATYLCFDYLKFQVRCSTMTQSNTLRPLACTVLIAFVAPAHVVSCHAVT